jgi:ribosome-binding protein aMBF1 (putative translation factor)
MSIWENLKAAKAALSSTNQSQTLASIIASNPQNIIPTPAYPYTSTRTASVYEKSQTIRKNIQQNIKTLRIAKGWSQRELACESGYSQTTIHRVEKGNGASVASTFQIIAALDMELTITPKT